MYYNIFYVKIEEYAYQSIFKLFKRYVRMNLLQSSTTSGSFYDNLDYI